MLQKSFQAAANCEPIDVAVTVHKIYCTLAYPHSEENTGVCILLQIYSTCFGNHLAQVQSH